MSFDYEARDNALAAQVVAAAAALLARSRPRIRIAAPQGGSYPQNTQITNGTTQTSGTDRIIYQLNSDYAWLSAVVYNGYSASGSGALVPSGNGITVRLALEQGGTSTPRIMPFASSTLSAVSTNGKTGSVLGDGEMQITVPTYKNLMTKNSYQIIRFYKTTPTGGKWPTTYGTGNYNNIDTSSGSGNSGTTDQVYGNSVNDGSDYTYTGNVTFGTWVGGQSKYWAPWFIIGEQITPVPIVLITGDSVSAGFGDTTRGYITRGLEIGGLTGQYINCGIPASTASDLINNHHVARKAVDYVDHVIIHTMSNDFNTATVTTLAAAQALLLQVVKTYARAHTKVHLATVLPRCATTDAGATYTNQTKPSWETLRVTYNNWLRDKSSNGALAYLNANIGQGSVASVFDPCVQIERNSDGSTVTLDANGQQTAGTGGYFLAGGSTDCTHPNATAAASAAASVPTNLLVLPF